LFGLDGVPENFADVIVTRSVRKIRGTHVHRIYTSLPRTVRIAGFPVTCGARTVMDLFAVLPSQVAEAAMEDALRKKITTLDRTWQEYSHTCKPGRNGCRNFRAALLRRDHRDGTLQSRMEAKLRAIVKKLPGDPAVPQFPVEAGDAQYFIDFAFPDVKLGVEAHSIRWHMGEAKWYYDMRRDRALKRIGWTLLYYGMDDLVRPRVVREEILAIRDSLSRRLF